MSNSRRDFLGFGTAAAVATLAAAGAAQAAPGAGMPIPPGTLAAHGALRLVTYAPPGGGAPRLGAVRPSGHVVDLGAAAKSKRVKLAFDPSSMLSLIAAGPAALAQARKLAADGHDDGPMVSALHLLAPIPVPARNVYAVGWNYLEHFEESLTAKNQQLPKHPVFFTKGTHTINGPYDPIPFDAKVSVQIDWEGELAVIIGKRGRNIAEADAMDYVFGFTVINDTTARDMQTAYGGQWFKGKSLDGHGPIGPWIMPAADLDYTDLHLMTRVNGVVKQDINTAKMYFKVPRLIAELSLGLTLEPGDIIASGTPSGTGVARTPQEFLRPGDVLETEIVEIGIIRNVITQTSPS
jgi:2-keto-4-pentenoate hydratase/2-oxohepta-3-ene-1,7-dioic acid hydratase in catechol pathway